MDIREWGHIQRDRRLHEVRVDIVDGDIINHFTFSFTEVPTRMAIDAEISNAMGKVTKAKESPPITQEVTNEDGSVTSY